MYAMSNRQDSRNLSSPPPIISIASLTAMYMRTNLLEGIFTGPDSEFNNLRPDTKQKL